MTDDDQADIPEVTDIGAMTPRQLAREMGYSVRNAEQQRRIARDEWCGDCFEVGPDGLARPLGHGEFWNPGPGETRSLPWPDGTYGRQPRNRIRRWRKAWAADRQAGPISGDQVDGSDGQTHDL